MNRFKISDVLIIQLPSKNEKRTLANFFAQSSPDASAGKNLTSTEARWLTTIYFLRRESNKIEQETQRHTQSSGISSHCDHILTTSTPDMFFLRYKAGKAYRGVLSETGV